MSLAPCKFFSHDRPASVAYSWVFYRSWYCSDGPTMQFILLTTLLSTISSTSICLYCWYSRVYVYCVSSVEYAFNLLHQKIQAPLQTERGCPSIYTFSISSSKWLLSQSTFLKLIAPESCIVILFARHDTWSTSDVSQPLIALPV